MRTLLALACLAALALPGAALEVPFLSGRVNDDARLLDPAFAGTLEARLKAYEARTGHQFAVLTIPSLQGASLDDYSIKVARTWKLGRKGANDGILLLVSRDDRKLRIEVGYGLEGVLTDAQCGRIIRDRIVPRFRGGDYAGGIAAGVDAVLAATSRPGAAPADGEAHYPLVAPPERRLEDSDAWPQSIVYGVIALLVVLVDVPLLFDTSFNSVFNFFVVNTLSSRMLAARLAPTYAPGIFLLHVLGLLLLQWYMMSTAWGLALAKKARAKGAFLHGWVTLPKGGGSSGGGFGGGGGFSGGGGSFGGGGASGSW